MKLTKGKVIFLIIVIVVGGFIFKGCKKKDKSKDTVKIIQPKIETIKLTVSTTGTILPKNRLEIKPPVNGRIEQVLIKEGQLVKTGEILAWMSSTERAALLDAARGQGEEALKHWQEVYKPIALIAPIDAEVIVGTVQPGKTVTTSDAVIVLSDRLIVRAQVDETDIGKIKTGQKATISLDAYSENAIDATAEHIYYESKTVNNVTIYEVDLDPQSIPEFWRSGMNANIEFIEQMHENVLTVPSNAIWKQKGKNFVTVQVNPRKTLEREIAVGIADDRNTEIISGLTQDEKIILKTSKYRPVQKNSGSSSPLTPQPRRR